MKLTTKTLGRVALVAVAAVAASALLATPALAQSLPTPDTGTLAANVKPIIRAIRLLMVVACLILGVFEAFKATRGQAKDWIKALMLWVGAVIFWDPGLVFSVMGMSGTLGSTLSKWGITGNAG